ncbi:MAG: glycosyltransferase, partial [Bacteroidetes bacterium]|nr:glycosyltransferase [Bacteroidota bacterium]
ILRRHSFVNYNEVIIIPQGFDPEDFPVVLADKRTKPASLKIAHAGTFYADRSPAFFFQALANVLRSNPRMQGRIEINLIGNAREEDKRFVKHLNLQDTVNFLGYLPHRECVKYLAESDLLWFVIDNDYQTPGKLYEYFGTGKPIIASLVEGYTKQLIRESNAAMCVPLKDIAAHELAIIEQFERFERQELEKIPGSFSSKFNRLELTGELAKQFESLMDYDRAGIITVKEQSI